jgi:hypothetical protein
MLPLLPILVLLPWQTFFIMQDDEINLIRPRIVAPLQLDAKNAPIVTIHQPATKIPAVIWRFEHQRALLGI